MSWDAKFYGGPSDGRITRTTVDPPVWMNGAETYKLAHRDDDTLWYVLAQGNVARLTEGVGPNARPGPDAPTPETGGSGGTGSDDNGPTGNGDAG